MMATIDWMPALFDAAFARHLHDVFVIVQKNISEVTEKPQNAKSAKTAGQSLKSSPKTLLEVSKGFFAPLYFAKFTFSEITDIFLRASSLVFRERFRKVLTSVYL